MRINKHAVAEGKHPRQEKTAFHPRVKVRHHNPRYHHRQRPTTTKVEAKAAQVQRLRAFA